MIGRPVVRCDIPAAAVAADHAQRAVFDYQLSLSSVAMAAGT